MSSYGHRELKVWQKAMALAEIAYRVTANFPNEERYGLVAQIRRAAISVAANIAEGKGRTTRGEYGNHLSIARGSLKELETEFDISHRLSYLSDSAYADVDTLCIEISKMLTALKRSILT